MQKICILGAGRSSIYLLEYLSQKASKNGWEIAAYDRDIQALFSHTAHLQNVVAKQMDVADMAAVESEIKNANIVISLLPPSLHPVIAKLCLTHNVHLATASYVSPEMQSMHDEVKEKGLVFLNEMGLDPGIDHMSAIKLMDSIKEQGGEIFSFESYCGGLVAEEDCRDNPWQYKFSWNPMNVILAGQGGMSVFRQNGMERYIPWHRLFANSTLLNIPKYGALEAYPNRDSLSYSNIYGLQNADTVLRGTLRRKGYCQAWQALVELGFTDNNTILHSGINSIGALSAALTGKKPGENTVSWMMANGTITAEQKPWFDFLEMDSMETISYEPVTSATLLRLHLEKKWKLEQNDRDEVIMFHRIGYKLQGKNLVKQSMLRIQGNDHVHTAMAKTVGLPLAMGVELILNDKITERGVCIPASSQWYGPVLSNLEEMGIYFYEYDQV